MELHLSILPQDAFIRQGQQYNSIGTDLRVGYFKGEDYEGGKPFKIALNPGFQTEVCIGLDLDQARDIAQFLLNLCNRISNANLNTIQLK